ncbi:MAG: 4Fe-4S binding protein [Pirellulales bacterium]|jgi:ferredoxin|nr:4Fe-4S binding protein [Pirellulales bacterium]MDI9443507.1 4Fe-4S binding protein [Planctomycetota bacterium]NLZ01000.1 4Fe-4S binding protein [Pirellulaceae bacterium]
MPDLQPRQTSIRYLSRLSNAQWAWLIGSLAICAAIITAGWILEPEAGQQSHSFTTAMSIREIAPKLDVTGKSLAREFGLPLDVPKGKPLEKLGVAQEDLDHVAAHLVGHQSGPLKYYFFAALVLWGLVFLTRLGRPDGSPSAERRAWYPRAPYVAALLVALAACGFALGKSPNPMEGAVKVFKSMVGLYPSVWEKVAALGFFLVLAVIGNKLVCGWACPFGALQELLYSLPLFKRIKRRKVPFLLSNAIRATLFVVMLLLLFGVVGGRKGFVLYHSMNPFNLFSLDFDEPLIPITILTASVLALLVYRPFCQFICPFGLISWLAERISLARVRIDTSRCNECGACIRACPLDAAKHRVAGRLLAADCYSCARCLNVCPHDAISYSVVFAGRPQGENASAQALDA